MAKSLHKPRPDAHPATPGLLRRLASGLYDWLIVVALMLVLSIPVVVVLGEPVTPGQSGYQIMLLVISLGYFSGFWSWSGQTPGMRAWRLRVTELGDAAPGIGRAAARFAVAVLSLAACGAGYLWSLADPDGCTWHDRWTGTRLRLLPPRSRD